MHMNNNYLSDDETKSSSSKDENAGTKGGNKPTSKSRSRLFRNRTRFNLNRPGTTTENPPPQTIKPLSVTKNLLRGRDRFRNLLNRTPDSTPSLAA